MKIYEFIGTSRRDVTIQAREKGLSNKPILKYTYINNVSRLVVDSSAKDIPCR